MVKKQKVSLNVLNGFKLIFRSILVILFIVGIFSILEVSNDLILSITSITGIIIGFASTEIFGQMVSGVYLIASQLFRINNLVEISGTSGVVSEIGLNYTTIQRFDGVMVKIPNKRILDSRVKNYTVKISEELEKRQAHLDEEERITREDLIGGNVEPKRFKELLGELALYALEDEITRYTFVVNAELSIPSAQLLDSIRKVCRSYRPVFKYKPHFAIRGIGWRVSIEFQIYSRNPFVIIRNYTKFVRDIAEILYEMPQSDSQPTQSPSSPSAGFQSPNSQFLSFGSAESQSSASQTQSKEEDKKNQNKGGSAP